ncbi:MAG: glycine betaine ABC transporter substrate-binding protein, partial [Gammaproteobacteria bacterium]
MKRALCLALFLFAGLAESAGETITVASKTFNESYVLAEIMSQLLEVKGFMVKRRFGMGGTLVCYRALTSGEVDVYAEYTGTLGRVILKVDDSAIGRKGLNALLAPDEVEVLSSFGFDNTYALAMKDARAKVLGISTVSQLAHRNDLTLGFSLEFLNRKDGWPGLSRVYGLTQTPTGIAHGLAYQAIDQGKIDVTDAYSTDGDIRRYQLRTLIDDQKYFPEYHGVPLVRKDMPAGAKQVLSLLAGRIDDERMRELNGRVMIDRKRFAEVATEFLAQEHVAYIDADHSRIWARLWRNTVTHLKLTGISLGLGCLVGVPLGILVFRSPALSRVMVYLAGLLQTIPSIALLALMIPLFGIGTLPAIVALFLYSILPILRNTITALIGIDPLLKRIAEAIGLTRWQQLQHVLVPMALPTMLAGIKTAAIISLGTATLAAFIGAGGLGEPIVTGLA